MNGTVTISSSSFTYMPSTNYNGADSFTYSVSDGDLTSEDGTVSVTINSISDFPVAYNNTISLDEDSEFSGILTHSMSMEMI